MAWSSSGDLLADRRFAIAQALSAEGDHASAADLLDQTIERVPDWAPAWLELGLARERMGQIAAAIEAYRRASDLDREGTLGAAAHLARLAPTGIPDLPQNFVRALFDDYAERFDHHLLGALKYTGPAAIAQALGRAGAATFGSVLDLGCGTGLMAREIAGQVQAIDGVDLSPRMIRQAEAARIYRHLAAGDIIEHLHTRADHSYDAVLAADVLVYFGDLGPVAAQAFRVLTRGGLFAFTVQRGSDRDIALGEDMRFQHARGYVARVIDEAGFDQVVVDAVSTREDRGVPVPGLVVVARRP